MENTRLDCGVEARRKRLFDNPAWNGLDYLEVSDDQLSLCVHFFGPVPENLQVENVRIEGGRRIRDIRVTSVTVDHALDVELDDCLRITLDKSGDFSTYRLCLVQGATPPVVGAGEARTGDEADDRPFPGIDPRYACLDFSFKVDCPSDLDCKTGSECVPERTPSPEINYLAKDYASFRQLILDRLAVEMPNWQEYHVPDIGVTLVELLAYVGDHLSYYQDAVATEAYLDTARQRISLRRHARLVDYRMHAGSNARAWVTVATRSDLEPIKARDIYFITGFPGIVAASGRVMRAADLDTVPSEGYEVFEPLLSASDQEFTFLAAHSEIRFYTWGDHECCLPRGATRATLLDEGTSPVPAPGVEVSRVASSETQRVLHLEAGDVLIFEEVLGPTTGNPADADAAHRHAVRLRQVTPSDDPVFEKKVLEVEWDVEDALPFPLCLSVRLPAPDCSRIEDVSVARGNVVLVDHGRTVSEPLGPVTSEETIGECACEGSTVESARVPVPFKPSLAQAPLTFTEPLPKGASASRSLAQDVRLALPALVLAEVFDDETLGPEWLPQYDLLASQDDDRHFVVEMDDDERAHLRFGDGELGRSPSNGTQFRATYRIGNGPAGNIGRDTITYLVLREGGLSADAIEPRNPLPARGGVMAEAAADVKLFAPYAFRRRIERAITADDYAALAGRNPKLQRAAAELRWTGSWYEARVAVDPIATCTADATLTDEISRYLFRYRRMGHDLCVVPAVNVPLEISIEVCVLPHYARGEVKARLFAVLGNRRTATGELGFFHPDNLSFGEGVYLSKIVAAIRAVEGVETVKPRTLKRLGALSSTAIDDGVLPLGPMEIAQLDNDPSFPQNGKLELLVGGGR